LAEDGRWRHRRKVNSWCCNGWKANQHLKLSWIYSPATAKLFFHSHDVCPVCLANGLRCTDMCKLRECENQATCVESSDEDEDDMENNVD
jgi:hypothetical protein